jgi:uncharacterized protein (TIGR03083 family)
MSPKEVDHPDDWPGFDRRHLSRFVDQLMDRDQHQVAGPPRRRSPKVIGVSNEAVYLASARERHGTADLIVGLDADQLSSPSLCQSWTIRTVAAHLVAATTPSKLPFVLELVRRRGDAHATNDGIARRIATPPAGELATRLRRNADSRFAPSFVGPRGPLTDVLVHGGDMRLPLGLPHTPRSRARPSRPGVRHDGPPGRLRAPSPAVRAAARGDRPGLDVGRRRHHRGPQYRPAHGRLWTPRGPHAPDRPGRTAALRDRLPPQNPT